MAKENFGLQMIFRNLWIIERCCFGPCLMFMEDCVKFYAFEDVLGDLGRHVIVYTFHHEPVGLWPT